MPLCFIILAMACFILFVLCSAAVAYYPMPIVRECPHCNAHFVHEETISGNTIGAKFYTDGRSYAPMLPEHPWLAQCPVCGGLFWVDAARMVEIDFDAVKGKPQVKAPSGKEMLDFLAGQALSNDKEIYLRLRVWWSANDVWRWLPNPKPAFSKEHVKNLKALSALLDESKSDQRIIKAEIARELGEFEKCLKLLSCQVEEGYEYAANLIRKLAEEKVRAVKPFEPGK